MGKNVIIFSDGTSNTKATNTNVYQFYKALNNNPDNKCFYDPGVGSFKGDLAGKIFGAGLATNIQQCYDFIVSHYETDDRLFLFGFSRGAYTVRSLGSYVSLVGLVEKNRKRLHAGGPSHHKKQQLTVQQKYGRSAFDIYRSGKTPAFKAALRELSKRQDLKACPVFGMGVWDTVGAIGLPNSDRDKEAFGEHYYHRMSLPKGIVHAYHALSIDDERQEFAPILFTGNINDGASVEQCWFPGMHSDIGGGYKLNRKDPNAKELSNISLGWMADKFSSVLDFDRSLFDDGDANGFIHDSISGFAENIYERKKRAVPKDAQLHPSVLERIKGPLSGGEVDMPYRPVALNSGGFRVNYELPPWYALEKRYTL
ncbi:MAG: DUF2235 domain-containing protein [Pseudomonadales bacterium]